MRPGLMLKLCEKRNKGTCQLFEKIHFSDSWVPRAFCVGLLVLWVIKSEMVHADGIYYCSAKLHAWALLHWHMCTWP